MKRKLNCGKFSLEIKSIRIATHKKGQLLSMAKSTWKSDFHPYAVFSTSAQRSITLIQNFALPIINKDQLKDLQNYLNQKMIAAIDIVDGSMLGDNLITSHQVCPQRSFQLKLLKIIKNKLHLIAIR